MIQRITLRMNHNKRTMYPSYKAGLIINKSYIQAQITIDGIIQIHRPTDDDKNKQQQQQRQRVLRLLNQWRQRFGIGLHRRAFARSLSCAADTRLTDSEKTVHWRITSGVDFADCCFVNLCISFVVIQNGSCHIGYFDRFRYTNSPTCSSSTLTFCCPDVAAHSIQAICAPPGRQTNETDKQANMNRKLETKKR
jgi:hypothetical protein